MKQSAYFHDIRKQLLNALSSSTKQIKIAMAWFTNTELMDKLLECLKNGIDVELILMDDIINHCLGADFNKFQKSGGKFHLYPKNIKMMHNKFCVIDDNIVITGSYNWTNYAEYRNCENIIISDDRTIIDSYLNCFKELLPYSFDCENFDRLSFINMDDQDFVQSCRDISCEIESIRTSDSSHDWVKEYDDKLSKCNISAVSNYQQLKPTVVVTEVKERKHPVSKYNIGFKAYLKEKNDVGMRCMIAKGTPLPCTISRDAWTNNDNTAEIECVFVYGENEVLSQCKEFTKLTLKNLPRMKSGEVKFKTNITFTADGHIHIEFICSNNGNGEEAKYDNMDFVEMQNMEVTNN